jgi:ferric-dicitrate binding protein FerR (iron transport regulator)
MTSRPDLAELAARALAAGPDAGGRPSEAAEARAIACVAEAIRARKAGERRRRWLWSGAAAAAAAIALAVGLGWHHHDGAIAVVQAPATPPAAGPMMGVVDSVEGEAFVLRGAQSLSVIQGSNVSAGDQIVVQRGGRVAFVLPTGTRITVEEGGELTVVAQGAMQLLRLSAGSVRADVQKLQRGERFLVRTGDAEIEVHGTSFRVATVPSEPSCGGGTTTRLSVTEGVVTVRAGSQETSVPAGSVWPSGCGAAVPDLPRLPRAVPAPRREVRPAPALGGQPSPAVFTPSQLAEQNDLYARAVAARKDGRPEAAIATLEQLVTKYPAGPLAESAVAERMTLLAARDPIRAAEAARAYVARYPSGFARAEAEAVLAAGPR